MQHDLKKHYKFIVIGAGAGGITAAVRFAQKNEDVLLVSKNLGGICTNTGCIPSKSLLKVAEDYVKSDNEEHKKDIKENVFKYVQHKINAVKAQEEELIEKYKVNYVKGEVQFLSRNKILIEFPDHKSTQVTFDKAVIATGSTPGMIPIKGVEREKLHTTNTIFYLPEVPKTLVIIGGGHVAAEVATALGKLGTKVIISVRSKFLAKEPEHNAKYVRDSLQELGVEIIEDSTACRLQKDRNKFLICKPDNSELEFPEADAYLIAVGRDPNTEGLNLEAAGVKYDKDGIEIDKNYLTTNSKIFAVGDCAMGANFTTTAENQAKFAVKKASFPYVDKAPTALPVIVFTDPLISSVGALETSRRIEKYTIDFAKSDKAMIDENKILDGEIFVDKYNARILGASIVGDFSEHIINFFTLAIHKKMTVYDLEDFLVPYPSYFYEIHQLYTDYLEKNKFNLIAKFIRFYYENKGGLLIALIAFALVSGILLAAILSSFQT